MPPARVWWHGIGTGVVTFCGAFLSLATALSGTDVHISLLAWGVLVCTALGAGATAMLILGVIGGLVGVVGLVVAVTTFNRARPPHA